MHGIHEEIHSQRGQGVGFFSFSFLAASGLSPGDTHDIISTTEGIMEFDTVCKTLQPFWIDHDS